MKKGDNKEIVTRNLGFSMKNPAYIAQYDESGNIIMGAGYIGKISELSNDPPHDPKSSDERD